MSGFLSVWDWLDIAGVSMVLVGVAGAWWVRSRKSPVSAHELVVRHSWESKFESLLIFGLAIELVAVPHHIHEGGKLKKDASEANERSKNIEATNLILKSNVLALETRLIELKRPRTISKKQREDFIKDLASAPKRPIMVGSTNPNDETANFMDRIADLLVEAGYSILSIINYECRPAIPAGNESIQIMISGDSASADAISGATALNLALNHIGYECHLARFTQSTPSCSLRLGTNDVMVFLIEKR